MVAWRLLRQLDYDQCKEQFFSPEVVATLDKEKNLICVRESWWVKQTKWVQREVWKMDTPYYLEEEFHNFPAPM